MLLFWGVFGHLVSGCSSDILYLVLGVLKIFIKCWGIGHIFHIYLPIILFRSIIQNHVMSDLCKWIKISRSDCLLNLYLPMLQWIVV